jgi:hypothetical protein
MGRGSRCWRCQLRELVTTLLTGPDGAIADRLAPLAEALITMPRPNSGYAWLRSNPRVRELLAHLADGQVELNHQALDGLPGSPTVEYLRGLLIAHGCLPPRDPHLAGYERWLAAKLARIADPAQRQLIDRFARWHLLRRLRRHGRDGAVPTGAFLNAKQSTTMAIGLLAWLDQRGAALATTTQHDLDTWFATGPSTRRHALASSTGPRTSDSCATSRCDQLPAPATARRSARPSGSSTYGGSCATRRCNRRTAWSRSWSCSSANR